MLFRSVSQSRYDYYDVDGITSASVFRLLVEALGAGPVRHFIPDRKKEGYGLTAKGLERCLEGGSKPKLLVVLDCGTNSKAEVEKAKAAEAGEGPGQLIDQILGKRGLASGPEREAFLQPKLSNLSAPEEIPGMAAATALLQQHLQAKSPMVIYSDYDVDGITSASVFRWLS